MRRAILTKLSKNEISVEEAERLLENQEKFNNYINGTDDDEGYPLCPVNDYEVVQAVLDHTLFEFNKNDIDINRLDTLLHRYRGRYSSVRAFANEYWGRLLNYSYSSDYASDFKNKYKSDVCNWISTALASGELRVITLKDDVLIFLKDYKF